MVETDQPYNDTTEYGNGPGDSVTGATEEATDLVQEAILQTDDLYEPYLHRRLLLAGRVVSDDAGIDHTVALQIAGRLPRPGPGSRYIGVIAVVTLDICL